MAHAFFIYSHEASHQSRCINSAHQSSLRSFFSNIAALLHFNAVHHIPSLPCTRSCPSLVLTILQVSKAADG